MIAHRSRLSPWRPRKAAGSPALLPSYWSNFSRTKAVGRCNIEYTARASTRGGNRLEKHRWTGFHGAMQQNLAALAEEAHVHTARMQIKAATAGVSVDVRSYSARTAAA